MSTISLCISTDRSDNFKNIADFVDSVRRASNVPDSEVEMAFDYDMSDHESATHVVDPEGEWNQKAIEVDNETVVVFRKEALTPEDGNTAWRIAYEGREIFLTKRGANTSRVLEDGQVMIKGVGCFPKTHFRVVKDRR